MMVYLRHLLQLTGQAMGIGVLAACASTAPYLDQVVFQIGRDQQALITQLEAGAIDAMDAPPVTDAARLKSDPAYTFTVNGNTGGYNALLANTSAPPLDNKQVRQALNYAINRQRFVDTVLLGVGTAEDLVWPSGSPAYEADKINQYAFDLERAKQMLAAAGASSTTLDLTYIAANAAYAQLAQILQADLASIGVTANLQPVEPAVWAQITPKAQYGGLNLAPGGFAQVQPTTFFLFSVYWLLQNNAEAFQAMIGAVTGPGILVGPVEQSRVERRHDVLCYTSAPFPDDTEISRPLQVHLSISTSAVDTDFTAKLAQVYPDGQSYNIGEGILRLSGRQLDGRATPVTPGEVYDIVVTLGHTSVLLRAGFHLRPQVSSSSFPQFDRNMNTGHPIGTDAVGERALQTVYHDAQHLSFIDVPGVPVGGAYVD